MYEDKVCVICGKKTGWYGIEYESKEYCNIHILDKIALNSEMKEFMRQEVERIGTKVILNKDNKLEETLVARTYHGLSGTIKSMVGFAHGQFALFFYQKLNE